MALHPSLPHLDAVLEQLSVVRDEIDNLEYAVVFFLRTNGTSWESIGEALGISRQAAASRFSKPKPRRRR